MKLKKNEQVISYLNNLASKYNTDAQGLEDIFIENNLDFELYLNEIMIEFAWQKLIFSFFSDRIILNDKEINDEINLIIKNKKNFVEYNLAEIEIISDNSENQKQINEIKEQIKKNGFKNTAIKYSASSSSLDGGNLGWINSKSLSEDILNKLKNKKIGDLTNPIILGNTITFIKILDKKSSNVDEINVEQIKKQIVERKKNEFLNLYSNNHLSKVKNRSLIEVK
jgi:parvulin-like peptidyl-prolyl isomerase